MSRRAALGAALAVALAVPVFATAAPPLEHTVAVESFELTVWEKAQQQPHGAILLVHGRTWSALPNFDLQLPTASPDSGRSVMDALAAAGYAAYAVDLRGYGATPRDDTGWLTPSRAAADVAAVLEWIAARHPRLAKRPA